MSPRYVALWAAVVGTQYDSLQIPCAGWHALNAVKGVVLRLSHAFHCVQGVPHMKNEGYVNRLRLPIVQWSR